MLAQADNLHKPARRSRRCSRKSAASTSSPLHSSQEAELSTDTGTKTQFGQPTRILRRGDPEALLNTAPVDHIEELPPRTPPRPKSMYAGSTDKQQPGNGSASESSQNKRKTPRTQASEQITQASQMPMMKDTPISTPRRDSTTPRRSSVTPNRTIETPSKAYAGPTFHASPAASSLPMPKFYSRSVPNLDKTKSLKTMMEQEAPDSSSGSEESPVLENAQHAINLEVKDESPLDIFFRADREAKGRTGSAPDVPCRRNIQANGISSPSGLQAPDRHHSCSSSLGGMFALEMDGTASEVSSGQRSPGKMSGISNRPASAVLDSDRRRKAEREEQRKAQTIALKKLLYSSHPQILHNTSTGQRPPSSKLRKEMLMPASPEQISTPEFPSTPTPTRIHNPTTPEKRRLKQQDGYGSPYSPITSMSKPDQGHDTPFPHATTNSKSIEDDLRRILKMNTLGSDGVTGLQS